MPVVYDQIIYMLNLTLSLISQIVKSLLTVKLSFFQISITKEKRKRDKLANGQKLKKRNRAKRCGLWDKDCVF